MELGETRVSFWTGLYGESDKLKDERVTDGACSWAKDGGVFERRKAEEKRK